MSYKIKFFFRILSVLNFLIIVAGTVQSQNEPGGLYLSGKITTEQGNVDGTIIRMTRNGVQLKDYNVLPDGKFNLRFEFNNDYTLIFERKDNFPQKIVVSTQVPADVLRRDRKFPSFPVDMNLFTEVKGVDRTFSKNAVLKIYYSPSVDNFISDVYYNNQQIKKLIDQAILQSQNVKKESDYLKKLSAAELAEMKKDYQNFLNKAAKEMEGQRYLEALDDYKAAGRIFPDEQYPKDRIAEINDLLAVLGLQPGFDSVQARKAQAEARAQAEAKAASDAEKLRKTQADAKAKADIEAEKARLAALQKARQDSILQAQAKAKAEVEAEKLRKALAEAQAKAEAKAAAVAEKARLAAEEKARQAAEKNEIDNRYQILVKEADQLAGDQKLVEAVGKFRAALEVKPQESYPLKRIEEIRGIIAKQIAEKKAYDAAIVLGDQAFGKKQYDQAKTSFQQALQIKNGEKYPALMISRIDSLESETARQAALVKAREDSVLQAQEKIKAEAEAEKLKKAQAEAEAKAAAEAEKKRLAAMQKAKQDSILQAQALAKAEAEAEKLKKAQAEADAKAAAEAEKKRLAAVQKARQDSIVQAQAKVKAELEAEKLRKAQADAEAKAAAEAEKKRLAAVQKARQDSIVQAQALARAEAEAEKLKKAQAEAEAKAAAEAEKKRLAAEQKARQDSILQAQAKVKAELEAEKLRKAQADAEARAKADAEKVRLAALQKARQDSILQAQAKTKAEAEAERARLAALQKARQDSVLQALAKAKAAAEAEKVRLASLLRARQDSIFQAQAKAKAEAEAEKARLAALLKDRQDSLIQAKAKAKADEEAEKLRKAQAQAEAKAAAEAEKVRLAALLKAKQDSNLQAQAKTRSDAEAKSAAEAEKIRLSRELVLTREAEELYNGMIANGDKTFTGKEYNVSRAWYFKALEIKPESSYALKRIDEINAILHSQLLSEADRAYQQYIDKGDEAFRKRELAVARSWYNRALEVRPADAYPKSQMADIRVKLEENSAGITTQQFKNYLEQGNKAFDQKQYSVARVWYLRAQQLNPADAVVRQKLETISKVISGG